MEMGGTVVLCGVVVGDVSFGKKYGSLNELTKEVIKADTGDGKGKFISTPITLSGGLPANKIESDYREGDFASHKMRIVTLKDGVAYTIVLESGMKGETPESKAFIPIFDKMVDSFQITK